MGATTRVYFDNAATTPVDPRVADAMRPFLDAAFGNPSSLYKEGREARQAVDHARTQLAALLGATPNEIVFTSGGTEADAFTFHTVAEIHRGKDCHIITSAIEHPAVLEACRRLQQRGVAITHVPVSDDGIVDPLAVANALRPTTRLVSIMAANNVVGTLQPIEQCAKLAHQCGALFHTDAVQSLGKLPLNVRAANIDLLSLSGHKIHGPKGIGALFVRESLSLPPLINGGGQEAGRRSGTENVPGIVGLGAAASICDKEQIAETTRLVHLREQLIEGVLAAVPQAYLIGHRYRRLPGHACFGFAGLEGHAITLLLALDDAGIAVSSGSACSAHKGNHPSHVLSAMGFDPVRARGSLRITLGRFNDQSQVQRLLDVLPRLCADLQPITTHH